MGRRGGGVLLYIKETVPAINLTVDIEDSVKKSEDNTSIMKYSYRRKQIAMRPYGAN